MSIGEALAEARRQAGLTIAQVSDQTRVRETIITAIERDDYSVCGGDTYARGYIRTIARAVGADPDLLIQEYNTARPPHSSRKDRGEPPWKGGAGLSRKGGAGPSRKGGAGPSRKGGAGPSRKGGAELSHKDGMEPPRKDGTEPPRKDGAEPVRFTGMGERLWRGWLVVVVLVMVGLWFVALRYHAGPHHAGTAAPSARALPAAHGQSEQPSPTGRTIIPQRTLIPASAAAFGPDGTSQGDNSDLAQLAIDGNPATAWHSDWYSTAHFGNLYTGTGLLVDIGRPATITGARIRLGGARGTDLQLRVGTTPALADLPPIVQRANVGGLVRLRLMEPAHGRYVLLWFTSLPPDSAGTFQVHVYNLRLAGRS